MTKSVNLLKMYRLNAYYAANPKATALEGATAVGFKSRSYNHYYNCVHLRDAKGFYSYYSLKDTEMPPDLYAKLGTRFDYAQQYAIIEGLDRGETITTISKRLNLHFHPVMVFSIVYSMYREGAAVNVGQGRWTPYSRQQYEAMAEQIKKDQLDKPLQPELIQAIREMFLTKKGTPFAAVPLPPPPEEIVISPTSDIPKVSSSEDVEDRLKRVEERLDRSPPVKQTLDHFSTVENTFALDVMPPHSVQRWLSREAILLFPKLIRGEIMTSRDEDAALFELEDAGMIEIPTTPSSNMMGGVVVHRDRLRITEKGWAFHRLIRDICEQTVYCCLTDMGAMMGFNIRVGER